MHVVSSKSISAALYVLFHASVWQVMASKMSSSSVPMVLRVKRKRIEKPADSLVIATKRTKLDPTLQETDQREFHFAGTVEDHHQSTEDVLAHVSQHRTHSSMVKPSSFSSLTISGQQDDRRKATKELASSRRFKLISEHRSMPEDATNEPCTAKGDNHSSLESSLLNRIGHVYDLEQEPTLSSEPGASTKDRSSAGCSPEADHHRSNERCMDSSIEASGSVDTITCNSSPMVREKTSPDGSSEYVYDLYYTQSSNIQDMLSCNWTSIHARLYEMELVHDLENSEENEYYGEDEDSNDEGNWRNDYPDELDSNSSIDNLERYQSGNYAHDSDDGEKSFIDGSYWN